MARRFIGSFLLTVATLFVGLVSQAEAAPGAVALPAPAASADEGTSAPSPSSAADDATEAPKDTLDTRLRVGLSAAFTQSAGMVGQQDGLGVTFGATLGGQVNWTSGAHQWRNAADYAVSLAYTSVIGELVKTADRFQLDSVYTWKGLDWLGPFVRLHLDTPLFVAHDVRAEAVDYEITYLDGSVEVQEGRTRLQLTSPLEPLQLKESLGVSLVPLTREEAALTLNVGVSASQVFAADALSVSDKKDTAVVEVNEIDSYVALGQTTRLEVHGVLADGWVTYKAHGELFVPFIDSSPKTKDLGLDERLNVSTGARFSLRIAEWASLDYELRALLQPQIQSEWQIQNVVMFTFGYELK